MSDAALPAGVVSPTRPLGDCMEFRVVGPALAGADPFASGRPFAAGRPFVAACDPSDICGPCDPDDPCFTRGA